MCKKKDWQIMVISIWAFGKHLLKNEQNKSGTSRKTIDSLVANTKIWAFKQNQNFGKSVSTNLNLTASQYLTFWLLAGDTSQCGF